MRTVLLFNCPDTMPLEALCAHFQCRGIVWPVGNDFIFGYLHLTNKPHQTLALVKGVEYFDYREVINEHRHLLHNPSPKLSGGVGSD